MRVLLIGILLLSGCASTYTSTFYNEQNKAVYRIIVKGEKLGSFKAAGEDKEDKIKYSFEGETQKKGFNPLAFVAKAVAFLAV